MKYASIIPLVGGENFGISKHHDGLLPEYVLSYTPFESNDSHYIKYLREKKGWTGEYVFLDNNEKPDIISRKPVDVVNTVCPCAGLSMLSTSKTGSSAREEKNKWLYQSAEYVLKEIGPKVFWGENAPQLFSEMGKPVREKLITLAKKYGYTLNFYSTRSILHGNCQIRPRTFYFFTAGKGCPRFPWINKKMQPIEDYLKRVKKPDDPMDHLLVNEKDPMENVWIKYLMHKNKSSTFEEYYDSLKKTTRVLWSPENDWKVNLNEVAEWFESKGYDQREIDRARHMQRKKDAGKNYWTHGTVIPKGRLSSFIGVLSTELINPFTKKYITVRDALNIMDMPQDFELIDPDKNLNHVCQNVPVNTARDMAKFVDDYLKGNLEIINTEVLYQNNVNQKEHCEIKKNTLF